MPANLTPQYNEAEERFKKAKTAEEKLPILKEMLKLLPKHKGTEKIQADLKTRISEMKDEAEKEQTPYATRRAGTRAVSAKDLHQVLSPWQTKLFALRLQRSRHHEVSRDPQTVTSLVGAVARRDS